MYRIVSIGLVIVALLFELGTLASAQDCPNIGSATGVTWTGTSERISYCMPYNTSITPVPPASPTFAKKWRQATTTFYQEAGSCVLTAFRTMSLQSDDGTNWYTPTMPEDTWYTGIIANNGTKLSMQAQPGPNNPPYILYGEITKVNRRGNAKEIHTTANSSLGDLGDGTQTWQTNHYPKCSYTSLGTMIRE